MTDFNVRDTIGIKEFEKMIIEILGDLAWG